MLKPTREWIIVEVIEDKEYTTDSGILIPSAWKKETTKKCRILLIGPEANKVNAFKIEDVVLCMKNHGIKVEYEDKKYEFMKEENFLGIIE